MTQQHRPPRSKHIYITISVRIEQVRALGTVYKRRMSAYGAKSAHRGIHSTWQKSFGALL